MQNSGHFYKDHQIICLEVFCLTLLRLAQNCSHTLITRGLFYLTPFLYIEGITVLWYIYNTRFCVIDYQKVWSYFLCRDGSGSKWLLVLKVWEQLCVNQKQTKPKHGQKAFAILLLKIPQVYFYPTQKLREENFKISILLFVFLLLLLHHT